MDPSRRRDSSTDSAEVSPLERSTWSEDAFGAGEVARASGPHYFAEYSLSFSHSAAMRTVRSVVEEVAGTSATVLIRGESGVGKDLVARAIHAASPRHDRPFIRVNCAALPAELLESELFGHEKGSFTGAYRRKLGKFEFAHTGSIFLDEIGDLPRPLQAKLLHVLQDLQFSRIGGRETIQVDVRIIGSTNRDLEAAMSQGDFREDLYYRLNVVEIHVPPLRERKQEIPALAASFLAKFNRQYGRDAILSPELLELFRSHSWPGNVRELENMIRRLVVLGERLPEQLLSGRIAAPERAGSPPSVSGPAVEEILSLKEIARRAAQQAETKALAEVLERVHWNRAEAARILKVSYKTLLNKIAECGLGPERPRAR